MGGERPTPAQARCGERMGTRGAESWCAVGPRRCGCGTSGAMREAASIACTHITLGRDSGLTVRPRRLAQWTVLLDEELTGASERDWWQCNQRAEQNVGSTFHRKSSRMNKNR